MLSTKLRNVVLVALLSLFGTFARSASAGVILVADRVTNSVYQYSESGTRLGTVLTDNVNLSQVSGMAVSPDMTKLYLSSLGNSQLVSYDYNAFAGTASNPQVIGTSATGIVAPSAIVFHPDGSKFYVANLGGSGVSQFNADGSIAGPQINGAIAGGSIFQYSGLAFAPDGSLLVAGFQDFPAATSGAVARSDLALTTLTNFIGPATSLNGAAGLLVNGNDLYVSSLFAGTIQKFDLTTGALDPTFNLTGLAFPQGLMASPDGNGFLAGILGITDGTGNISHYDFDGNLIGTFALASDGGFEEATSIVFVAVPEPSSIAMLAAVGIIVCYVGLRRRFKNSKPILTAV